MSSKLSCLSFRFSNESVSVTFLLQCKAPYDTKWDGASQGRCPNLVRARVEKEDIPHLQSTYTYNVSVTADQTQYRYTEEYDSLADMWSTWHRGYLDADYPRLFVRFEDMLFHPEQVLDLVATQCVGLPIQKPFKYRLKPSKNHGTTAYPTNFIMAINRYGTERGRFDGYAPEDLKYAQKALDPELMGIFHYRSAPL
jgi:hypothetical protein